VKACSNRRRERAPGCQSSLRTTRRSSAEGPISPSAFGLGRGGVVIAATPSNLQHVEPSSAGVPNSFSCAPGSTNAGSDGQPGPGAGRSLDTGAVLLLILRSERPLREGSG
jgi:hypothetical protein